MFGGMTRRNASDIARDTIRRQVAVMRFRELRAKTRPFAKKRGLLSDEDVLALYREPVSIR
jgi:hypothetical protein